MQHWMQPSHCTHVSSTWNITQRNLASITADLQESASASVPIIVLILAQDVVIIKQVAPFVHRCMCVVNDDLQA
jgi:hypothetical protein